MYFFFLFLAVFNSLFKIPVKIENARTKLALTIPTEAPITAENDAIEMLPVVTDKTINDLSKYSEEAIYLLSLHSFSFFNLRNKIIFNFIDFVSPKLLSKT